MSQRALNPEQFHFAFKQAKPKTMGGSAMHEVRAYGGGHMGSLGEIYWHHKTGEITNIAVHEPFRRQGVATSLLGEARRVAGETRGVTQPRHSEDRTDMGEAWARSLGERLPARAKKEPRSYDDAFNERFEAARRNQGAQEGT